MLTGAVLGQPAPVGSFSSSAARLPMFHHHYVGHFDPRDPVDTTLRPCQPKVQRPILREGVEQFLESFADDISEFVCWCEQGYVICNWSYAPRKLWEAVHRFAYELAHSQGAVVMSE